MTNEFDSKVFRAQIMIEMLPIMYREIDARGGLVRDRKQQAVEAAAEIAEMAERRLINE